MYDAGVLLVLALLTKFAASRIENNMRVEIVRAILSVMTGVVLSGGAKLIADAYQASISHFYRDPGILPQACERWRMHWLNLSTRRSDQSGAGADGPGTSS